MSITSSNGVTSSLHMLSLLDEDDTLLQSHSLSYLNDNAHRFWHEMAPQIAKIETLYEDEKFPQRELAAIVASKVFYHLSDLDDALKYALGAGRLFDVGVKSEYVQTLIAKCIDEYTRLRVFNDELRVGANGVKEGEQKIDERLVSVVERMFDRCLIDGHFKQAIGIAIESRRLDVLSNAILKSGEVEAMTDYTFHQAQKVIVSRKFRQEVLGVLVTIYRGLAKPDYIQMCQCLLFLQQPQTVAEVLDDLIRIEASSSVAATDIYADDKLLMAYQVAFDLQENQNQPFLNAVISALPTPAAAAVTPTAVATSDAKAAPTTTAAGAAATTPSISTESKEEDSYGNRMVRLKGILSGDIPVNVQLNYLYGHNRSDLNILKLIKDKLEPRNMVTHNATVLAHAIMHVGTTSDTFLRDNLDWLAKATNWAKFSATASIGVIHKGHHKESQKLLGPYLPQPGTSGSPYQEGGALYALGLIHANHGHDQVEFLMTALRNSGNNEIVQHGACLGLGLAAMATSNRTVYDFLKTSVLFTENAVAGEAAALAMGLVLLGTANGAALEEMVAYAHDTRHEKIIRGIAMGIALIVYGVEEQADVLIEQLLTDKDPLLRYGGMYAIAMAYCGTSNNNAIRRLLHSSVSDVSDDVRRAAVTGLGFVLCNKPDEVPRVVNLLSESYNSHVRYGAALAIGIACAGTGNKDALNVLEPLCKDRVDLTRQGALIATSMVLIQHNDVKEPKVKTFRKTLAEAQSLKGDTMTKLGAIFAAGILDAGGRNVTMSLLSPAGHKKMAAVVGMAMFPQYWYWYPYTHFISLAFTPTAVIGLSKNIKMPKSFTFTSQARPSLFAIPPDVEIKKAEEKKVVKTSTLSVTAKAKARAKKKGADGNDMDTSDDKTTPAATPRPGDTPKNVGAAGGTETKLGDGASSSIAKDGDTVMATEDKKEDKKDATTAEAKAKEEADKKATEEKKPEPEFEVLSNPSRVTWAQQKHITYDAAQRYQPIKPKLWGVVMLRDSRPDEPEEWVVAKPPKVGIPGISDDEPEPPASFEYLG